MVGIYTDILAVRFYPLLLLFGIHFPVDIYQRKMKSWGNIEHGSIVNCTYPRLPIENGYPPESIGANAGVMGG